MIETYIVKSRWRDMMYGQMQAQRSILLVEDDHDVRDVIAGALERCGYRVLAAANGREAIEQLALASPLPSVIVLDWMMPIMGGFEFLTYQATDPDLRTIPVLVLSAVDRALRVTGLPVAAVLEKPVRMRTLIEVIDRLSGMPRRPPTDLTNFTGRFPSIDAAGPSEPQAMTTTAKTRVIRIRPPKNN
jgi:CheY-like chemotaxis protein